jgi:hypothetical protein
MRKKLGFTLVALLLLVLPMGNLWAATDNSLSKVIGAPAGYSFAIQTDPEKIPYLMIRPSDSTRLQGGYFTLRLHNAVWDLSSYAAMGIESYGSVNSDGDFAPDETAEGYLTRQRSPWGVGYTLRARGDGTEADVILDNAVSVSNNEAIYIPLLVEVTGNPASVEIYDPSSQGLTVGEFFTFASAGMGSRITTRVKPGEIQEFARNVTLADISIDELEPSSLVGSVLTLTAPSELRWINIDQIQLSGRNTSGLSLTGRAYATGGVNATENQSVLRLEIALGAAADGANRSLILKNLQLAAQDDNERLGDVFISFSGCNMEDESVRVARRIRIDYLFEAEARPLPLLSAGYNPVDAASESIRALTVTFEEAAAGRWQPDRTTVFSLPAGVTARAVKVNTTNLASDLPKDLVIRRIDENAYRYQSSDGGTWTLAGDRLTLQGIKVKSGAKARIELSFYVVPNADFTGNISLSASGSALRHEALAIIGEAVEKAVGPAARLTIGDKTLIVGDQTIAMDVAPYIENNNTMVPVRYVASALGLASDGVIWDSKTRTVTIKTGDRTAVLTVGSAEFSLNDTVVSIPTAPTLRDNRAFLPFRVLGEQVLGVNVRWDNATKTAILGG